MIANMTWLVKGSFHGSPSSGSLLRHLGVSSLGLRDRGTERLRLGAGWPEGPPMRALTEPRLLGRPLLVSRC